MSDAELIAFLETQPRSMTYSDLSALMAEKFGATVAWDAAAIRQHFLRKPAAGRPGFARDPEVRAYILDRIWRLTGKEILDGLRTTFPDRKLPSKSSLYRWIAAERARQLGEDARAVVETKRRAASQRAR